ncbi:hypothetical protein LCGC14_1277690 [marine sediment metagenome]|uniref:DNA methylase N-4/N-6 domain-containing protein n=1 Tax=marine sediment metagenome TaxID=412755 RepID=A0A0F9NZ79_9ZZZZ
MKLINGDCAEEMKKLDADSIDAIVTDPPYGLEFMGKNWDHGVPGVPFWQAALRTAKPGAHLLAFGGTRTHHRLMCAIEDAGWEIRDCLMWVYGSVFPKSLDKAIDGAMGVERAVVATRTDGRGASPQKLNNHGPGDTGIGHADGSKQTYSETAPATDAAKQWDGWGTALKPAWEPIILARKPLKGTVAANVLEHGTGGLNIDGCRIAGKYETRERDTGGGASMFGTGKGGGAFVPTEGRWPANVVHDGSEEVVGAFPVTHARANKTPTMRKQSDGVTGWGVRADGPTDPGDSGSAARFFYCAKSSRAEREAGLEGASTGRQPAADYRMKNANPTRKDGGPTQIAPTTNHHPTVKPVALMRWLCRLVTPPGGLILDPFCGSGSTGMAAVLENFKFIGIDKEKEYIKIAQSRIDGCVNPNAINFFE